VFYDQILWIKTKALRGENSDQQLELEKTRWDTIWVLTGCALDCDKRDNKGKCRSKRQYSMIMIMLNAIFEFMIANIRNPNRKLAFEDLSQDCNV
jgi:hypothetical protein